MENAAFTGYIDVAQVVLYLFWIFFFGLVIYLRREDKREGYPLESDRSARIKVQGFPSMPGPKSFLLEDGERVTVPRPENRQRPLKAEPSAPWPGAPLDPVGDPMLAGVGPGAWADRSDHRELLIDGGDKFLPLRAAPDWSIEGRDPDPRGMVVKGADGVVAGKIVDLWLDLAEPQPRFLELELGESGGGRRVMLPITFARIDGGRREVRVQSILGRHFAQVPALANPDRITMREEDMISAYYGGGTLFAEPSRRDPIW